jgi:hypothetical protein
MSNRLNETRAVYNSRSLALLLPVALACGDTSTTEEASPVLRGQDVTLASCDTDQVPVMTSASAPGGLVTTSGEFSSQYRAFQAFDASPSSMWISETFETPALIGYQFADGPRTITRYAIRFVNGQLTSRAPRDWTFEGFDGANWVVLDSRVGETGWAGVETRSYDVASPGSYSQYRLSITDDNDERSGVVVVSMGDLQLFACGCGGAGGQVPVMTSAAAPSGLVTTSGEFSSQYQAFQAFDASPSSMWISETFETPALIGYQFGDGPHTITNYAIRFVNGQLTSRAPRDWTFEGFDGASWVALDSRVGETGWGGVETRSYDVASPGAYGAYQLRITDDNDARSGVVVVSMGHLQLNGPNCE